MPYIVQGELMSQRPSYIKDKFDYSYPEGLDLDPMSDFHYTLRSKILQRALDSRKEIQKRFSSWNEIDRILTVYIPLTDKEKAIKRKDPKKPVSIIFPYTYSMLEALMTYISLAFFQDPIFRYEGVEDDDTIGAMLLELVIRLHCIKHKVPLALHSIIRDSLAYGVGIGVPGWRRTFGKSLTKSKVVLENGTEFQVTSFQPSMLFEGNDLSNIDPYLWLPDPSVSSDKIQEGEYIGWIDRDNYMNLLSQEQNDQTLFNVRYLAAKLNKRSSLCADYSERGKKFGTSQDTHRFQHQSQTPVDVIKMYINLIPRDWGLGDSEYPEKWFFALASDDIIISCHRADHHHGMYPIAVASPEFDGYSITPISRLEILRGLQETLDFLFNSHISNVRKAINDMLVVDPYLVNIKDLEDPEPGKLVRLRRPAWGRGVDKVVQQLIVQDITRSNIADSAYITQWMDRISGADQSMLGVVRQSGPERLTKGEFQGTRTSAVSRLQRIAMIISYQLMQDIGTMFAVHTQQYMSKETYIKTVGRYSEQLHQYFGKNNIRVSPEDIYINYDVIVHDGSIPGGNFSEAWIQMFSIIAQTPELYQQFDVFRIFSYIAQQMGAKNVDDFRRVVSQANIQTAPTETVLNEAQKGNLVPMEEL